MHNFGAFAGSDRRRNLFLAARKRCRHLGRTDGDGICAASCRGRPVSVNQTPISRPCLLSVGPADSGISFAKGLAGNCECPRIVPDSLTKIKKDWLRRSVPNTPTPFQATGKCAISRAIIRNTSRGRRIAFKTRVVSSLLSRETGE